MAGPKLINAKCPTCGADLPLMSNVPQITCRYCQNVIHVEHRKPPPEVRPFGTPGAMPSRTLYVDPAAASKAGKQIGCIIAAVAGLPILIPLILGVGPWAMRTCKGAVKPFPINCGLNEEIEVSGTFETTGPIIEGANHNCKIHIKNSKLKAGTFMKSDASNLEITLDHVTLETTGPILKGGQNVKWKIHESTLVSQANAFDTENNMEIQELEGSTIESKTGSAFKSKYNLKLQLENSKIRGKKNAIDTDANFVLGLKKGSEVTSSEGIAIKTTSGFKLEAEGGKIEGAEGAIVATSGLDIEGHALTLASNKDSAIKTTSGMKLELTDCSVTSQGDVAIEADGGEYNLINTKVTGTEAGMSVKNGGHIKLTKKSRVFGATGIGVVATSNCELNVTDAAIEGALKAFKGTVNTKMKLGQGARLAGKRGGVESETNFELEGTGATIEGGTGPGIQANFNTRLSFKSGVLRGTPAIQLDRKPISLDLDGTRVEGEQKIPGR